MTGNPILTLCLHKTSMTVQSPITRAETDDCWSTVTGAANQWRGAAIQIFAQTEFAVSETLERLSLVPERGEQVRLRPLVGQRFADLADALSGPFAAEGGRATEALARFRRHEAFRSILCHGVAKVLQDRTGGWAIIFRLVTLKGRSAERSSRTVEQNEAEQLLAELQADGRKLSAALQSLRARLPA